VLQKKNPDKTFLGLSQNCITCHIDEHRGQLAGKCETCHSTDKWTPANSFDHSKSAFSLTGKHLQVDCQKCHPLLQDRPIKSDNSYAKLKGIAHRHCQDCHTDIHNNRFGANCLKCHSTTGWHGKAGKEFKHDITNYPLRGKHRYVQCNACHKPGRPLKIKNYSVCRDCHSDYHNGQFVHREQNGACEECHSVEGFSPSSFTIGQHKKTKYPLQGAHLAIPCLACHKKTNRKIKFSYQSVRCQSCHIDPHKSEVDAYLTKISLITKSAGCEHCHQESSWSDIQFDHTHTDFPIEGKHLQIKCGQCHNKAPNGIVRIKNLTGDCHSCHQDVHYGQFKESSGSEIVKCENCHTPHDWKASKFDHNTKSNFPLEGRHSSVECVKCHIQTNKNNVIFTLYRPLSTDCKACHGSTRPPALKN